MPRTKHTSSGPPVSRKSDRIPKGKEVMQEEQAPPTRFVSRKLGPTRAVLFDELDAMFPELRETFQFQGWIEFMSSNTVYYPSLVIEFYENMFTKGDKLYTTVRGKSFCITLDVIGAALDLKIVGTIPETFTDFNEDKALFIMTQIKGIDYYTCGPLNANKFPPLQRVIHHMITTIIWPKGGSRNEVTRVHKFFFYCLFNNITINLPRMMLNFMKTCKKQPNKLLGFAAPITKILNFVGIDTLNDIGSVLSSDEYYGLHFIQTFMRYKKVGGEVVRSEKKKKRIQEEEEEETDEEEETKEEEEMEEEESDKRQSGGEADQPSHDIPMHDSSSMPVDEPRTKRLHEVFSHLDRLENRMDVCFAEMNSRFGTMDARFDEVNGKFSEMQSHVDNISMHMSELNLQQNTQTQLLQNIWGYISAYPPPPPPPQG